MQNGFLISFEGGEGSGKTVQIKRLHDVLNEHKLDVVIIREPGGTVISEQIREVLLTEPRLTLLADPHLRYFYERRENM